METFMTKGKRKSLIFSVGFDIQTQNRSSHILLQLVWTINMSSYGKRILKLIKLFFVDFNTIALY